MRSERERVLDAARGALAGVLATWAMGQVTSQLYERENGAARAREDRARGGRTAYSVAAGRLAHLAGRELPKERQEKLGSAIHWALGATAGAAFGVLRPRLDALAALRGIAFGAAFWLLVDEVANPLFGMTPGPRAFPWQTHARGLAGHLTYGAVADATLALATA